MPKKPDFAQFFNKNDKTNQTFDKKGKKVKNQNNAIKPKQMNSSRKSN